MHIACRRNNKELVEYLGEKGADVGKEEESRVKYLLDRGADENDKAKNGFKITKEEFIEGKNRLKMNSKNGRNLRNEPM